MRDACIQRGQLPAARGGEIGKVDVGDLRGEVMAALSSARRSQGMNAGASSRRNSGSTVRAPSIVEPSAHRERTSLFMGIRAM
jgi:hypothetical protein